MLQQICEEVHNFFISEPYVGSWSISGGMISLPFLMDGQRFWITSSVFNDGVYTYHSNGIKNDDDNAAAGLSDEDWSGTICAMAVPPKVIALSGEISSWVEKYGGIVSSPYQSENFNGYSYTKASGANGGSATWQSVFADRLKPYRRISM